MSATRQVGDKIQGEYCISLEHLMGGFNDDEMQTLVEEEEGTCVDNLEWEIHKQVAGEVFLHYTARVAPEREEEELELLCRVCNRCPNQHSGGEVDECFAIMVGEDGVMGVPEA